MTSTPDKRYPAAASFKLIKMPRDASREEKREELLKALASLGISPKPSTGQDEGNRSAAPDVAEAPKG